MSYNGSGTFVINTAGQPVVSGTVISSTAFNALTADLATGLSTAITKDGQTTPTANIPMGNNKITNLAVGTAATDAANLSQVQSTTAKLVNSISGADTITGTMSPNLAAYATGQMFYFIAAGDNTGAVTLNIDSLGAKSVTRDGSVALAAGDIKSGEVVVVVYDGTRFQVVSQINSSGNATFANVSITSALNVGGVATFSAGTAAAPSITTSGDTNNGIFFPAADVTAITTAGSERLRVNASGNVGIGTTSPSGPLHVATSSGNCYVFSARASKSTGQVAFQLSGGTSGTDWIIYQPTNSDNLTFFGNSADRMTLDTSGNLSNDGNYTSTGAGNTRYIGFNFYGNLQYNFYVDGTSDAAAMLIRSGTTERARFTSGGNLLINNTSATDSKLIVTGSGTSSAAYSCIFADSNGATLILARNDGLINTGTRSLSPYNNTTASAANLFVSSGGDVARSTSSLKYKTDVQDATHGLSEVMQLRPVTYKGKNDGDTVFGGLIAEEVHAVGLTEFVQYAADGSPDALAYGNMVSLLVKAIQELKAELDAAKVKIAALEAK